jgi:hypothetical protein
MTDLTRKILKGLSLVGFLLVGWLAIQLAHMSEMNAWAGSQLSHKSTKAAGDAERGRAVFNGKGVCYYAMALMETRINDRNSQPTPPRSLRSSIRNRSI